MARRPLFKHLTAPEPALAGAILWPMAMASEPWEEAADLDLSASGAICGRHSGSGCRPPRRAPP